MPYFRLTIPLARRQAEAEVHGSASDDDKRDDEDSDKEETDGKFSQFLSDGIPKACLAVEDDQDFEHDEPDFSDLIARKIVKNNFAWRGF